ncbi:MAG TPA: redoxin domain-containing protein [Pirellulales bacterium]|nr:redoxin domain-containing protein [Pirellulales bacterium]
MPLLASLAACPAVAADGFEDDPEAHGLYDKMLQAMRDAETLSFDSQFDKEALGIARTSCTYRVWLKKPNFFRLETTSSSGEQGGVLVGDGVNLWVFWPNGRPRFSSVMERNGDNATRSISYMTKPAADAGKVSIQHEAPLLGAGMGFSILDASIFHRFVDSLSKHIDGIRTLGKEAIGGHECRKIEVSILDGQRSWYLWLSSRDSLPRKLVEIVRVDHEVVTHETWSSVNLDKQISEDLFRWTPPAGWQEWKLPDDESGWPAIGSRAPDFDLKSIDGKRVRLSDHRGQVVWLNFWRIGCPPCVAEVPFLQRMHLRFKDAGLVLVGVNVTDDRKRLSKFLDDRNVSYLNILDKSDAAQQAYDRDYGVGAVPMHCLIGADGAVIDVWVGNSEERTVIALRKAGFEVPDSSD